MTYDFKDDSFLTGLVLLIFGDLELFLLSFFSKAMLLVAHEVIEDPVDGHNDQETSSQSPRQKNCDVLHSSKFVWSFLIVFIGGSTFFAVLNFRIAFWWEWDSRKKNEVLAMFPEVCLTARLPHLCHVTALRRHKSSPATRGVSGERPQPTAWDKACYEKCVKTWKPLKA